ncbi:MAG: hypothetical protein ACI8QF_002839 [Limisphaerales bacterium]|jgi:hypothetical protein
MKKVTAIFSVAALLTVCATSSLAQQAQVSFFTIDFVDQNQHLIFQTDGMTRAVGPNIVAQIAAGPMGGTLVPIGSPEALSASSFPGFVLAGGVDVTQAFGTTIDYQIRAWDITTGATFDSATTRGFSPTAQRTLPGDSTGTPPDLNNFTSFNLEVVPEPSTVALGVIGGLALLMRRRK